MFCHNRSSVSTWHDDIEVNDQKQRLAQMSTSHGTSISKSATISLESAAKSLADSLKNARVRNVAVIGGGPVGALCSLFLASRGWHIDLFERRPDIRTIRHEPGLSINLELSARGQSALEHLGLKDFIEKHGVRMTSRVIHDVDGVQTRQVPLGEEGEYVVSISRHQLAQLMLDQAEASSNVRLFFNYKLEELNAIENTLNFLDLTTNQPVEMSSYDLIIGCDGSHSAVRRGMLKLPMFSFSQEYVDHGFLEMPSIGPNGSGEYAMEPNSFHIWPRGDFVLIALPNLDMSFTVTLFASFDTFHSLLTTDNGMVDFFKKNFPDALKMMGEPALHKVSAGVRPGAMVSVKCSQFHHEDRVLLMGDAAHAMVPFYGQGMNCGFEDCLVLHELLDLHKDNVLRALGAYSEQRCVDAHAINDLSLSNYDVLLRNINTRRHKFRHKLERQMSRIVSEKFTPMDSMVIFSRTRYHEVAGKKRWQDRVYKCTICCALLFILLGLIGAGIVILLWRLDYI